MAQSRYLIGLFFVLVLALIGLIIGTVIGGVYFVPEGSGLAGPAIALGYGFMGLVVAVIVGILLARVMPLPVMRKVTLGLGVAVLLLVGGRILQVQVFGPETAEQGDPPPSPYRLPYTMRLEVTEAGRSDATYGLPFRSIEVENELDGGTFEIVTAEANPRRCRGDLAGLEPVDISSGLQRTASVVASHYKPCTQDTTGTVLHHLTWDLTVDASLPEGEIDLTRGCLERQEGPRDLVRYLRDLHPRAAATMTCEPMPMGTGRSTLMVRQAALTHGLAGPSDEGFPDAALPLGVGIVRPRLEPGQPLYFYAEPDLGSPHAEGPPVDSVTFVQGAHYVDIATAPPWLAPEVMKLDYNLLYFRAETFALNWIEVVVGTGATRWDPRTLWVNRHVVDFEPWVSFLLTVPAVEVNDSGSNPVRSGPSSDTAYLGDAMDTLFEVIAVQGAWMKIRASRRAPSDVPTGWVQWHDGKRLLITYFPLS